MATKIKKSKVDLRELWIRVLQGEKIEDKRVFLKDPKFAYLYSKYFLKERWPEKDEVIFYKDLKCAYLYAIFLEGKVPEHLHNFMIAKNLEDLDEQEKHWVGQYFDSIKITNKSVG